MRFPGLIIFLTFLSDIIFAANSEKVVSGIITNASKSPIPFASVYIENTSIGTMSNEKGEFTLPIQDRENATIVFKSMGYQAYKLSIESTDENCDDLKIVLEKEAVGLNEVVVKADNKSTLIQKSGFAVASVDTRDLQSKSIELTQVLDRTAGLRVRQDGGLGSQTSFNINGLSGNAVRIFIDGVPMESYGSSYSINSLPVSLIDRVDVYKGVVPIELGNDAMGGAINIVTKELGKNGVGNSSVNASYSVGSFNTHRADFLGTWRDDKTGITSRLSTFYNYSDNNYWVWSDDIIIIDYDRYLPNGEQNPNFLKPKEVGAKVRRFNDAYYSYGAKAEVGVTNKPWADQFFLSFNASADYKESQHGARMIQAYGERYSEGWTIAPSISYKKKNLGIEGLNVTANFQYSKDQRSLVDTTTNTYDWYGNIIPEISKPIPGESGTASLNVDDNNNYVARTSISYHINPNHMLALNYSYNQFVRSSDDELRAAELRAYGTTNSVNKQIVGLTYQNEMADGKLRNSVFAKYYYNHLKQNRVELDGVSLDTINYSRADDYWGAGATTTFAVSSSVRFNASVEQAIRLVGTNEVFGNVSGEVLESLNLEPEKSLNVNVGGMFKVYDTGYQSLELNTNLFYRNTYDRIRRSFSTVGDITYTIYENIGHVVSKGIEAQLDYRIGQSWHVMLQGYYLESLFMEEFNNEGKPNINYKSREPNMPYLTFNASASHIREGVFKKHDQLSVSWYASYIHEFYFDWDNLGNQGKPLIPTQLINDVSVSYRFPNRRVALSLDAKNIFNQIAFDNYAVQKPGRAFYAKIAYRFSK